MRAHLICFKRKEKTIMVKVSNIVVRFKLNRRLDPARLFNINNIQSKANGKLAQIKSSKMKGVARARVGYFLSYEDAKKYTEIYNQLPGSRYDHIWDCGVCARARAIGRITA